MAVESTVKITTKASKLIARIRGVQTVSIGDVINLKSKGTRYEYVFY